MAASGDPGTLQSRDLLIRRPSTVREPNQKPANYAATLAHVGRSWRSAAITSCAGGQTDTVRQVIVSRAGHSDCMAQILGLLHPRVFRSCLRH